MENRKLEIPKELDIKILEYASKKQYKKNSVLVWSLRIAAVIAVAFTVNSVLNFDKGKDIANEKTKVVVAEVETKTKILADDTAYDEFDLALQNFDKNFNEQFDKLSDSLQSEMKNEIVFTNYYE